MPTSILDLLTKVPNPILANSIPFFDGCDWTLITLPVNGLNSCADVQSCITGAFIGSLLQSSDNSINIVGNDLTINPLILQSLINVTLIGTLLTVGGTTVDLNAAIQTAYFTITDGSNSTQINFSDVLTLVGADGLSFTVPFNDVIQIGLPTPRQHMQVLTRDAVNNVAYRENNQCCAQTLSFDTLTNILSISGTNAVDLTSINTDNQELILAGNILSITQLNSGPQAVDLTNINEHTLGLVGNLLDIYGCDGISNDQVDLTNVNEHTLGLVGNLLSVLGSDGLINFTVDLSQVNEHTLGIVGAWTCSPNAGTVEVVIYGSDGVENNRVLIPRPAITCCDDVMACAGIQAIIADIVILTNRVIAAENAIQLLQGQLP